jgi:SAM-dependent methyltransferase|tara:strand:- start:1381 stop:2028 length:648 start_codon:yes stop_codon:yes gene_type:complete
MHIEEAIWIGSIIEKNSHTIKKILNTGSSTLEFRTIAQPHIDQYIFKPLKEKNTEVLHLDLKKDTGVDIQCDILDLEQVNNISKNNFDCLICSNLLEHVEDVDQTCKNITKLIKDKGLIILTVPYVYPKHADPIDNLFRPTPKELSNFFPNCTIVEEEILAIKSIFFVNSFFKILKSFIRLFLPFFRLDGYKTNFWSIVWLFKKRKVTCLLLKKD